MRRILAPAWGTLLFGVALVILWRELHAVHLHDLLRHVREVPARQLALAFALTALNYLVLSGYDFLALRTVKRSLPYGRIALASFVSHALGNSAGALLFSDSLARYRLYSSWGLSTEDIARVVIVCTLSVWLGLLALGGVTLLAASTPMPEGFPLSDGSARILGLALVIIVAAYLIANRGRPPRFNIRGWEFEFPGLGIATAQLLVSALDWALAALALYVLLPTGQAPGFPSFLGVVLVAHVLGMLSQVPGGLGVFEGVVVLLLGSQVPPAQLSGILLLYRLIYYLLPLAGAAVVLAVREVRSRAREVRLAAAVLGEWAPGLVPPVLSFATLVAGALLLFSGATPAAQGRLAGLERIVPLPVLEISHFTGSLVGASLLLLARGLQRRLDAAYHLVVVLLVVGIVASLLKGLDFEEAIALLGLLLVILPCRGYFYRQSALTREPFTPGWIAAVAVILASSVWLGFFSYKHVEYSDELWWQFTLHGETSRFLRATVGAIGLSLLFAIVRLLRAAPPEMPLPSAADLEEARAIVRTSRETYAYLALLGDKGFLWGETRQAFIMYGVTGRSWVAMGDPVGRESDWADLVWRFREMSDRHEGHMVFLQVGTKRLSLYLDVGLTLLKVGEEALVRLDSFNLEGSKHKALRQSHARVERQGFHLEIVPAVRVGSLLEELRAVSDAWLAAKKGRERGFSLGFFDPRYLMEGPMAIVRREGQIVGFANLWAGGEREELSVDLMRYLPDGPPGIMDYLFVELIRWGKDEGYRWFNLGLSPLSGLEARPLAPLWNRIGADIFRYGDAFYNFQGLRQYKEKFEPVWEPKYLASPGGLTLPRVLADVAAITAGTRTSR